MLLGVSAGDAHARPRVWRQPLEIRTTPAVPGLAFQFAGRTFVTDRNGGFVVPISLLPAPTGDFRALLEQLSLVTGTSANGVSYRLDPVYQRYRVGTRSQSLVVFVGLDLYIPVRFSLLDRAGAPIDPGLFQAMTIKRSDGAVFRFNRGQVYRGPSVLRANRITRLSGGLISKDLGYRIQSVLVGGNNVVYRAQQVFTPGGSRVVRINLLFYSVKIAASDRLFGFGVGSGIRLDFPDGTEEHVPFVGGHRVALSALPRGNYKVSVDSWGLSARQPLSITRDQVVKIRVVSYLDISVMVGVLLAVAIGLIVIGRSPMRRAPATGEVVPALVEAPRSLPVAVASQPSVEVARERPRPRPRPRPRTSSAAAVGQGSLPQLPPASHASSEVTHERPRTARRATVGPPPLPQFPPRRGNR